MKTESKCFQISLWSFVPSVFQDNRKPDRVPTYILASFFFPPKSCRAAFFFRNGKITLHILFCERVEACSSSTLYYYFYAILVFGPYYCFYAMLDMPFMSGIEALRFENNGPISATFEMCLVI
eukprot:scaffold2555_cov82-Cylindrotheca_fusiformis.AAC.2